MSQLTGYTLPLSPSGQSSLVPKPPWFFGGDAIDIAFRTDVEMFKRFLPEPFELSDEPGLMAITVVDMTSVSDAEAMARFPERSQYRECLIKLHCSLNGQKGWYVPMTWVNNDFTLMRGFIQGFGKKLAQIHISKLHDLNPMIGGKRPGAKLSAICESFHGVHFELGIELESETEEDHFAGNTMFVMRHFPDIENPDKLVVHEISELVVRNARKAEIWQGSGTVKIRETDSEEITCLQPLEIVNARIFREGFELVGGRVLHKF